MAVLYQRNLQKKWEMKSMEQIFSYYVEGRHVVSLVGGGGKTTLLYALAAEGARRGLRTVVTTTTHIMCPEKEVYAEDEMQMQQLWEKGSFAVMGTMAEHGKLTGLPEERLPGILACAELVLVEADGAKRLPCKVPAAKEPVLLPKTELVIAVVGITAVGRPLPEVCFRAEQAMELLRVDKSHLMTEKDLAVILASEQGARKLAEDRAYLVVINQCDTLEQRMQGEKIAAQLRTSGVSDILITSMLTDEK